jgi:hypothetical protein
MEGSWSIATTGPRLEAVVRRQIEQRSVVNDKTIRVFPDDRSFHAVVEDLARRGSKHVNAPAGRYQTAREA